MSLRTVAIPHDGGGAALFAGAGPQWSKIFLLPCHVLRGRSGKIESNRVAPEGGVGPEVSEGAGAGVR